MRLLKSFALLMLAIVSLLAAHVPALASGPGCPRPNSGDEVAAPADLFSVGGVLNVTFNYFTALDSYNRTLFCFVTPDGQESPTLHVTPGDTLNITLHNMLPAVPGAAHEMAVAPDIWGCGWTDMNSASVNIHFHGTNTRPICHSDEVVHTLVDAGDTFTYRVQFPVDQPPGLYWYHPHVHGISDFAVEGGATGAIVVEGIEKIQPAVAGLPERILIIRDQRTNLIRPGVATPPSLLPSWDVTLNYVPIAYPANIPAVMKVAPNQKEFWRVANTSADTIVDVALKYDGAAQPLEIVGLDGVPTGSHDGVNLGHSFVVKHILIPPAGRVEFIITTPSAKVTRAMFKTYPIDTGPQGDTDTGRPLAALIVDPSPGARKALRTIPQPVGRAGPQQFERLDSERVTKVRTLYFSESQASESQQKFFITVAGQKPVVYNPNNPPAIVTTQGAVEQWTIENRAGEPHEFHIHQIHFKLLEINHVAVTSDQRQFYDTYQVPYWTGSGPYPSITVAMDFRGDIAGDFLYHCHILDHEDNGMMALIRVYPRRY